MVVVAAAVVVFDLFWEILARFAPGSGTLYEPLASHRSGTWVRDILPKDSSPLSFAVSEGGAVRTQPAAEASDVAALRAAR